MYWIGNRKDYVVVVTIMGILFILVPCPKGTSYDLVTKDCSPCSIGKYQDEEGWLVCKPCPAGTTTYGTGSYDAAQCQGKETAIKKLETSNFSGAFYFESNTY